jgi:acyl carrier protein
MHPGFGDSIFQLILACLPDETSPDVVFAVVGIDRFEFHGGQQSGPLYCHARLLPKAGSELTLIAEIQVQDGTGRVVARAEGVYAKRFEIQRAAKAGRRGSAIGAVPASMPEQPRPVTGHGLAEILAAAPEDRPIVVRDLLVRTVTSSLRLETADLDPQLPLQNFGLDSLMALEVRDALTAELGVALPVVSFLDGSGLAELGDVILRVLDKPAVAAVATQ